MARHSTPHSTSQKVLSRRILVNIKRDMTEVTPRVIWAHEKPILEELHGEGNVNDVDPEKMDEGYSARATPDMLPYNKTMETPAKPSTTLGIGFAFIGNPEVEYARLSEAYGKHPKEDVLMVEKVYGRFQSGTFARVLGEPEMADLPSGQLRQLLLAYGYAPEPHKDAGPDEKNAMWKMRRDLAEMDHAALVKVAEEFGVQIG